MSAKCGDFYHGQKHVREKQPSVFLESEPGEIPTTDSVSQREGPWKKKGKKKRKSGPGRKGGEPKKKREKNKNALRTMDGAPL